MGFFFISVCLAGCSSNPTSNQVSNFTVLASFSSNQSVTLQAPYGIYVAPSTGNVYVTNCNPSANEPAIVELSSNLKYIAGFGKTSATADQNQAGIFFQPRGITSDGTNFYISDWQNSQVQDYNGSSFSIVSAPDPWGIDYDRSATSLLVVENAEFQANLSQVYSFNIGLSASSPLENITQPIDLIGVTADSAGNIYVTDNKNERIIKFNSAGVSLTSWGSRGSLPGQFSSGISGIMADSSNNIWVTDMGSGAGSIQEFSNSGAFEGEWKAPPSLSLFAPADIQIGPNGNFYVCDAENSVVYELSL